MQSVEISYKLNWCEDQKVKDLTVIHYGAKEYIPGNVTAIVNDRENKPFGGLWTSPVDSNCGWKNWCDGDFRDYEADDHFKLKFKPGTKILLIDSMDDLNQLPLLQQQIGYSSSYWVFADYELLATLCDAIWLTEKGQSATRFNFPVSLSRWDCESVLIINKECCYQIK